MSTRCPADVQREREASRLRLLDVWSSLAERYARRSDEDDIVDIRTGKITKDRGFFRNSRKVDFGAIAAPATEDAIANDEDEENKYDTDELDTFADTTSEIDNTIQSEIGLRVRPVPPVTPLDLADAEDLRAFLEAEQRRKQLCGSEDEDSDSTSDTESRASEVEQESAADFEDSPNDAVEISEIYPGSPTLCVDSASGDELDNWDIDESSVISPVLKEEDNDSDIEIIDGPTPSPLKYNQKPNLQVANNSQALQKLRTPNIRPYVLLTPRKSTDRKQRKQHSPSPEMLVPLVLDPRAQFIITQAMQQLSALVGTPSTLPHDSSIPYTPSRGHKSRRANSIFKTPSHHPHPHPYSCDPNLSLATSPPGSPESLSSLGQSSPLRKSSMARSCSRGRRVSFKIDDDESSDGGHARVDIYSSPSNIPSRRKAVRKQERQNSTKSLEGKRKARAETPNSESSFEDSSDCEGDRGRKAYLRGRTPGPNTGPPRNIKRGQDSEGG